MAEERVFRGVKTNTGETYKPWVNADDLLDAKGEVVMAITALSLQVGDAEQNIMSALSSIAANMPQVIIRMY